MNPLLVGPVSAGSVLSAIEYELLGWEDPPSTEDAVDAVSTAVSLRFGNGEGVRFCWIVREGYECLTTAPPVPSIDPTPPVRKVDATARWAGLRGAVVANQLTSLHETEWGLQPWAYRLVFDNAKSLVIALGELSGKDGITYIPDNLIVTDAYDISDEYWPPAAQTSAWVTA